jgi:predicted RNA binding protein YcfA (HicA-like mRNA interferase family)
MTRRLPVVKAKEVIRIAESVGSVFDRKRGSHAVYYRPSDRRCLVIPVHSSGEAKPKTLAGIIADMGLTLGEFRKLI